MHKYDYIIFTHKYAFINKYIHIYTHIDICTHVHTYTCARPSPVLEDWGIRTLQVQIRTLRVRSLVESNAMTLKFDTCHFLEWRLTF